MRSLLLCGLISVGLFGYGAAQQGPALQVGPSSNPPPTVAPPPIIAKTPLKPSRLACAAICNRAFIETSFSDDDKKWFAQCAGALLCQGKPALPLASQPYDPDHDHLIGDTDSLMGVRNYFRGIMG
jgi:hypothetical protein